MEVIEIKNVFKGMSWRLAAVVGLCLLVVSVSASYMIYSNVVTENVSAYTVVLTSDNLSPHQYENVTFTATLDLNGVPAGSGRSIIFYQGTNQLGTNVTDGGGIAVWTWNMTNFGALDFKAGFSAP